MMAVSCQTNLQNQMSILHDKTNNTSRQERVTDVSLNLKGSDTESENLSSLIQLSVSDGQKTDSSKDVSFISI